MGTYTQLLLNAEKKSLAGIAAFFYLPAVHSVRQYLLPRLSPRCVPGASNPAHRLFGGQERYNANYERAAHELCAEYDDGSQFSGKTTPITHEAGKLKKKRKPGMQVR